MPIYRDKLVYVVLGEKRGERRPHVFVGEFLTHQMASEYELVVSLPVKVMQGVSIRQMNKSVKYVACILGYLAQRLYLFLAFRSYSCILRTPSPTRATHLRFPCTMTDGSLTSLLSVGMSAP